MTYTAQPPREGKPTRLEGKYSPAYFWWSVRAPDGSTVAFAPNKPTARRIAALLEEHPAWNTEGGR